MSKTAQAWAAEFIGTFIFFTIGAGAVILTTSQLADYGVIGVALAHGLALAAMITMFGPISGGHFNPAVTLSAWVGRKITSAVALGYVASQILGALAAGGVLRAFFQENAWKPSNLGSPSLSVSTGKGVLIEAVLTFAFILVIWGTGIDGRNAKFGGFPIGITLAAIIIAFGPLTGVALNPARFIGTAAVAGNVKDWWVYFLGPGIGGAVAGIVYPTLFWDGWPWASKPTPVEPTPPAKKPAPRKR